MIFEGSPKKLKLSISKFMSFVEEKNCAIRCLPTPYSALIKRVFLGQDNQI
jgi:hypothetical protein